MREKKLNIYREYEIIIHQIKFSPLKQDNTDPVSARETISFI